MRVAALLAAAVVLTAAAAPSVSAQVPDLPIPPVDPDAARARPGRARPAAVRDRRRRRLPRRPPVRHARPLRRRSSWPRSSAPARPCRTATTSSACTATSSTRPPACQADQVGRFFKDATFGVRAGDVERRYSPRDGRHDRARQGLRRAARLRRDARRRDVRARLRGRRGPAVLHGRAAPRRPRRAGGLRRRRERRRWTPSSGRSRPTPRPTCSARPTSSTTCSAPAGATIQRDVEHYLAGVNAVHLRGEARSVQAARRVRRDRQAAGPGPVEGDRRASRPRRSSAGSSARAAAPSWSGGRSAGRCATASAGAAARACSATSARPRTPRRR